MINRVCVYGTLRKGYGLNRYIQAAKGELVDTVTLRGYRMYSFGAYPAINETENPSDQIVCEIYQFHCIKFF